MTVENLNMDFAQAVSIDAGAMDWIPSPLPGVERRPLARAGAENGHATSLVRYAPGSAFDPHVHGGGEEFLVLEGVFSDESGAYGAGTYVRNPPGSSHRPSSPDGCLLFVKLHQMVPAETRQTVVDTTAETWLPGRGEGHTVLVLYQDDRETVALERLLPGRPLPADPAAAGGEELLVVDGSLSVNGYAWARHSWLRRPPGSAALLASAGEDGATLWVKRGHLSH